MKNCWSVKEPAWMEEREWKRTLFHYAGIHPVPTRQAKSSWELAPKGASFVWIKVELFCVPSLNLVCHSLSSRPLWDRKLKCIECKLSFNSSKCCSVKNRRHCSPLSIDLSVILTAKFTGLLNDGLNSFR